MKKETKVLFIILCALFCCYALSFTPAFPGGCFFEQLDA